MFLEGRSTWKSYKRDRIRARLREATNTDIHEQSLFVDICIFVTNLTTKSMYQLDTLQQNCVLHVIELQTLTNCEHSHFTHRLSIPQLPATSRLQAMTLLEVFTKVPASLEACVNSWDSRLLGIRALRLVCKDSSTIALRAISSISLQIGCVDGTVHEVHQAAVLVADTPLKKLDVTRILWAGGWCLLRHVDF